MSLLDSVEIPRREVPLIIIVGTPDSMAGIKIQSVNQALKELVVIVNEMHADDYNFKIAILEFSSDCKWMYDRPKAVSEFAFLDLEAGGSNNMGAAFLELNKKLSRDAFMSSSFRPILILISDCDPTDDWEAGINKLKKNIWYDGACKVAISIGIDANQDVLKEFTNNIEAVIEASKIGLLGKIITRHLNSFDDDTDPPGLESDCCNSNHSKLDNMKKYEQVILKFKIADLMSDEQLAEVHLQLAIKGAQGFKLINSHIHSAPEAQNDGSRFLFCIMEREFLEPVIELPTRILNDTVDDDW